eukprot:717550-Rhodomonas_salina.3
MSGTDLRHAQLSPMVMLRNPPPPRTDVAYAASCLRACYAMSGTELLHAATSFWYQARSTRVRATWAVLQVC